MKRKPAAKSEVGDLLNLPDFSSVKIDVTFQNMTSREKPLTPDLVSLQEVDEESIVLELPRNSCNVLHNVVIEITRTDPEQREKPLVFQATGKVAAIEETDNRELIRTRLTLVQFEESEWRAFLAKHGERQEAVNKFLREARG